MSQIKRFSKGMRVRVKFVPDNVDDKVKTYVGKTGKISHGGSPSDNGIPGYYITFDDGSHSKRFYHDELEVLR